ncbi:N-(5'-phosphoribosyl)anthranilate isomerase [Streptomyces sp. NPDC057445]|uniref:phosphoribosylanthranilate isomerase n=1 Tax=Streptomyces sp. NPDC057445 TaxID=3346136 RepID=UPI0036755B9D
MLVKFCGATTESEVAAVATAGADLVGLWYAVPGGPAELAAGRAVQLCAAARETGRAEPVLVTFSHDTEDLLAVVEAGRVPWVQLHGFQAPSVVRRLRRDGPPGLRIVKVLHVDAAGRCLEGALAGAYEKAGADCVLYDAVGADGRIGSTARSLDPAAVTALAGRTGLPFLLAGGLHAQNRAAFEAVVAHPRFLGIDVDSAARGPGGLLDARAASAVAHAWRAGTAAAPGTAA